MTSLALQRIRSGNVDTSYVLKHGQTYDISLDVDGKFHIGRPDVGTKPKRGRKPLTYSKTPRSQKPLAHIELTEHFLHLHTNRGISIRPHSGSSESVEPVRLTADSEGEYIHIFLREHDVFCFEDSESELRVAAQEGGEIQVTSSPALENDSLVLIDDVRDAEADVVVSRSFGQASEQKPRLTPHASIANTDKIEETPATVEGRFRDMLESGTAHDGPIVVELTEPTNDSNASGLLLPSRTRRDSTGSTEATEDEMNEEDAEKVDEGPEEGDQDSTPIEDETFSTPMNGNDVAESFKKPTDKARSQDSKRGSQKRAAPDEEVEESKDLGKRTKRMRETPMQDPPQSEVKSTGKRGRPPKVRASPAVIPEPLPPDAEKPAPRSPTQSPFEPYKDNPPRIVFSQASRIGFSPRLSKFLKNQGCVEVKDPLKADFDVFCTGPNELKKTVKLLLSVALGKVIVHDDWISASFVAQHLVDPSPFLPSDPDREKEWGFYPTTVLRNPREKLFHGYCVYFTPALKNEYGIGFKEIERVLLQAGASEVYSEPYNTELLNAKNKYIILVSSSSDKDAIALQPESKLFSKDLVSLSILRGKLDLKSDEFMIEAKTSGKKKK